MDIRKLTLHQLRVFLAVARRRSFTRAAEDLLISQSAVSAQIRELTGLLGVPLFDQVGKKIHITGAGSLLEEQALRVEGVVNEIDGEFLAWRDGRAGVIRVGGSTSIGIYLLPSLIASFTAAHPGVELKMEIENTGEIEARMLRGELDAAFLGRPVTSRSLMAEALLEDEIVFASPPSHRLAGKGTVPAKALAEETVFVREPGSATRLSMEQHCLRRNVTFGKDTQLGSVEAIKQAVMAGLGLSYFSSLTVRNEMETGRLMQLPVRGMKVHRTFYLVGLKGRREMPALRSFMAFARDWNYQG